jgi:hypothetical protein
MPPEFAIRIVSTKPALTGGFSLLTNPWQLLGVSDSLSYAQITLA